MDYFATRHYGLCVDHPKVMPYFTRKQIAASPEDFTPEVQALAAAPLDDFAFFAGDGSVPMAFLDPELLEPYEDKLNREIEMKGTFRVDENILPDGVTLPPSGMPAEYTDDVRYVYNYDTAHSVPLDKQPKLLSPGYAGFDEIIAELKQKLAAMDVQVPDSFPWYEVVGCIDGVVSED